LKSSDLSKLTIDNLTEQSQSYDQKIIAFDEAWELLTSKIEDHEQAVSKLKKDMCAMPCRCVKRAVTFRMLVTTAAQVKPHRSLNFSVIDIVAFVWLQSFSNSSKNMLDTFCV
jgi:hypothetical protein